MATNESVSIFRGGSYALEIELIDADGAPLDPSGMLVVYEVFERGARFRPTLVLAGSDLDIASNLVTVRLTTALTALLDSGLYEHELWVSDEGERYVMMTGRLTVGVSQAAFGHS